jgi:hypothetical protein
MAEHAQGGVDYGRQVLYLPIRKLPSGRGGAQAAVEEKFPRLRGKVIITEIGTIIASPQRPRHRRRVLHGRREGIKKLTRSGRKVRDGFLFMPGQTLLHGCMGLPQVFGKRAGGAEGEQKVGLFRRQVLRTAD